jgi:transposase InsO family protein
MYKFSVPNNVSTDNGTLYIAREFKDFFLDLGIKINYTSVSHPHSNSQVELSNGMTLQGLKPRIFDRLKPYAWKRVKVLPSVLWALCSTLSQAKRHTPFSLVYGSEATLPTEVEHKSFCVEQSNEE